MAPLGDLLLDIEGGRSRQPWNVRHLKASAAVLKVSAIKPGLFVAEEAKALSPESSMPARALIHAGDVPTTRANTTQLVAPCAESRRNHSHICRTKLCVSFSTTSLSIPISLCALLPHRVSALPVIDQREASGTNAGSMKNISQAKIRELVVPTPSLERQRHPCCDVCSRCEGPHRRKEAHRCSTAASGGA